MIGQLGHRAHEAARKEAFRDVKTLQFVHGLELLLSLGTRIIQGLVLLLDELDLSLDLLSPLVLVVLLSLLVLLFEFADLLELSLFFHFENGLLARLSEQHIENWLHFSVEVE